MRVTPSHVVPHDEDWDTGGAEVHDLDVDHPRFPRNALRHGGEYLTKSEYLSKAEAGEIVSLNPKTIEREIQRGRLRAFKLAGRVRIRREDLEAWIEASQVEPSVHDI